MVYPLRMRGRLFANYPVSARRLQTAFCCFAYDRLETVPIDVWIARVLKEAYFPGAQQSSFARAESFASDYFGSYAGYAQQYLFHHWRLTYRRR